MLENDQLEEDLELLNEKALKSLEFLGLWCRNPVFRLDALALSVIATATWLAGWVAGCLSQPVLYQND